MVLTLLLLSCGARQVPPPPVEAPPPPYDDVRLDGTEPVVGRADAPITVVQYSDFLCPHCARGFEVLAGYIDEHPDVRLVWKTFPLTQECNPLLGVTTYADRCTLAYLAECGARQGKFRETATAIYGAIGELGATGATTEAMAGLAATAGLEPAALAVCLAAPTTRDAVIVDANEGMRLAIRGTPTFWVSVAGKDGFSTYDGDPSRLIDALDALGTTR